MWVCLIVRRHSLICSAFVAGLTGNELYSINLKSNLSRDKHVRIGSKPYPQISTAQMHTFSSSKRGLKSFARAGFRGGKPSSFLVSACEINIFVHQMALDWSGWGVTWSSTLAKLIVKSKNVHILNKYVCAWTDINRYISLSKTKKIRITNKRKIQIKEKNK